MASTVTFKFTRRRERELGEMMNEQPLVRRNGKPLPQHKVNFCIKNLIMKMILRPSLHSSPSLKADRAIDQAKALKPACVGKKWKRGDLMSSRSFMLNCTLRAWPNFLNYHFISWE